MAMKASMTCSWRTPSPFRQKDRVDEYSIGRPIQERDQLGREGGAVRAGQQHVLVVNVAEHDAHGQAALSGAPDARPVLVVPLLRVLAVDRHGAVVAVAPHEAQRQLAGRLEPAGVALEPGLLGELRQPVARQQCDPACAPPQSSPPIASAHGAPGPPRSVPWWRRRAALSHRPMSPRRRKWCACVAPGPSRGPPRESGDAAGLVSGNPLADSLLADASQPCRFAGGAAPRGRAGRML